MRARTRWWLVMAIAGIIASTAVPRMASGQRIEDLLLILYLWVAQCTELAGCYGGTDLCAHIQWESGAEKFCYFTRR